MFNISPKLALGIVGAIFAMAVAGVIVYLYKTTLHQSEQIGQSQVVNKINSTTITQTDQSNKVTDQVITSNIQGEQQAQNKSQQVNDFINNGIANVEKQYGPDQPTDLSTVGTIDPTAPCAPMIPNSTTKTPDVPHTSTPTSKKKPIVNPTKVINKPHIVSSNAAKDRAISKVYITAMWMTYCNNTTDSLNCPATTS